MTLPINPLKGGEASDEAAVTDSAEEPPVDYVAIENAWIAQEKAYIEKADKVAAEQQAEANRSEMD